MHQGRYPTSRSFGSSGSPSNLTRQEPYLRRSCCLLLSALSLAACGTPTEAERVQLPVLLDASGIQTVTTDLGYVVSLTEARFVARDLTFAIAGEAHEASASEYLRRALLSTAHAHPGHYQGGDVTGELRGRFLLDWLTPKPQHLGDATLLVGEYRSANFTFAKPTTDDGLADSDALVGHTAVLRGHASNQDKDITFTALITAPTNRELVGAPCVARITRDSHDSLRLRFHTKVPQQGNTLFDGIDFGVLDYDKDGSLTLAEEGSTEDLRALEPGAALPDAAVRDAGPDLLDGGDSPEVTPAEATQHLDAAYARLRRTFMTHDHFDIQPEPTKK